MKKVILNLGTGTLAKGCESVMGEILGGNPHGSFSESCGESFGGTLANSNELAQGISHSRYPIRFTGKLPPAAELAETQQRWQQLYAARNQDQALRIRLIDIEGVRYSETDFHRCRDRLITLFNNWLNSPDFLRIDRALRTELERSDDVQIILETTDVQIRKLPWHLWQLLSDYSSAELTLSALDWRPLHLRSASAPQARILATFGNHEGLNLAADLKALSSLENTHLSVLESPPLSHLHEMLWQPQGWDVFFFAGHSQTEGEIGIINLNRQERLNIAQIKYALSQAIANGLKIAIFNSCDGLGLAQQLSDLQIPYVVVMREPVPDSIAQQFLRYLLTAFAAGAPFHLAMREARQRLSGLENEMPCASWLPIIWQNPTAPAIYWQDLQRQPSLNLPAQSSPQSQVPSQVQSQVSSQVQSQHSVQRRWVAQLVAQFQGVAFKSLVASGLVLGIRALGLLEPIELAAYDHLMRQRPTEPVDERIVVVEISQETTSRYKYPLPDEPLTALIDRLIQGNPLTIGLDLHRAGPQPWTPSRASEVSGFARSSAALSASSLPFDATAVNSGQTETGYEKLLRQLKQTPDLLLVCFYESEDGNYGTPAQLPKDLRTSQVGFSDIPIDRFNRLFGNPRGDLTLQGSQARMGASVRRQWLSYDAELAPVSKNCETSFSLSFQLVFRYLSSLDIVPLEVTANESWQMGSVVFKSLPQRMMAYQRLDPYTDQILLNYRANQPGEKITFEQLMSDDFDLKRLQDKIVLVGYTAPVSKDYFETPYGPMAGLWVHAHMVSQMLGAVLENRPLIQGLPQIGNWQWGDWFWVMVWGCAGGCAGWSIKAQPRWLLSLILGGLALYGLCWLALIYGLWLPLIPSAIAAVGSSVWLKLSRYTAGDLSTGNLSTGDLILEPVAASASRSESVLDRFPSEV